MADATTLTLQLDPALMENAEALYGCFGLTLAQAFNIFLYKSLMENGLPFELRQPRYSAETQNMEAPDEGWRLAHDPNTKRYHHFSEIIEEVMEEIRMEDARDAT